MRCTCCNSVLTDYESTIKHGMTGAFMDTCLECLADISQDTHLSLIRRKDLFTVEEPLADNDHDGDMGIQIKLDNDEEL